MPAIHFHDINHSGDWKHTIFSKISDILSVDTMSAPNWCKFLYAHHLSGTGFGKQDIKQ